MQKVPVQRMVVRCVWAVLLTAAVSCVKPADVPPAAVPSLLVHYYRYNDDYSGWNVWAWPFEPPGDGKGFPFESKTGADGFVTAKIYFPTEAAAPLSQIGIILRKSEKGNDWAQREGSNDRFTGAKEIWIVENDTTVYLERPVITEPPILFAAADSPTAVRLTLIKEPVDYGTFAVFDGERKLAGVSARAVDAALEAAGSLFTVHINLEDAIDDPAKLYTVRDSSGAFAEQRVTMRGILDGFYYAGTDLGLTYRASGSRFTVWAPSARAMSLALYDSPGKYNAAGKVIDNETTNVRPMEKNSASGVWSVSVNENLAGKFYLYRAEFADSSVVYAADPYARAVSANGQRMAIVNMETTNPQHWQPQRKPPFKAGAWQDAVIYEVHVRDFSIDEHSGMKHKGKFLAFTERGTVNSEGVSTGLDHLVKLGITHVHLLPAFDFASINELTVDDPASADPKFNWGYDPMHYNVPEGSYATNPANPAARITEFKAMVQALHDAGIRVIMDVVYNHTFQTGGWPFDALVPGYYYRSTNAGAYANGSACGNEVASERPMVRKFIIDSCRYWAREYNVDGFRFDLMGLIDTPTMKQLTEELRREVDPSIIIYGEPWQAGGSVLPEELQTSIGAQQGLGFAIFNDRIRTAIKGGSDDASRGFATGAPSMESGIVQGVKGYTDVFTSQANESINYVTAHDNLNLWDKIALSLNADNISAAPYGILEGVPDIFESDAVKAALLANGIVFTSQGIPFFQAGDEMLRSKFGDHNSYSSPDSINQIRWENASRYRAVVDYYAGLIHLRREHPAFRMSLKKDIEKNMEIFAAEDSAVSFVLKENANGDSWRTIFVAYNGGPSPKTVALPGAVQVWHQVVDSRRAGIETLAKMSGSITLPPLSMAVLHE